MFRFAIKAGLATAAVYYTAEQGIWKDSETTSKIYETIQKESSPYIKQVKDQIPFELPTPRTTDVSNMGREYWNAGVKAVFGFLLDLPQNMNKWGCMAYENVQSFVDTPSITETTTDQK